MAESILVVRREFLAPYLTEDFGLIRSGAGDILRVVNEKHEFHPRPEMEDDPTFKQIIPYVLLSRMGEILALRRLKKGGEKRLHGQISIGVGGHINPVDDAEGGALRAGLRREVDEEVGVEHVLSLTPLGVINNDLDEVGRVHLGFLFRMEVAGEVTVRETEKLRGEFVGVERLREVYDQLEGWSQIALEAIE